MKMRDRLTCFVVALMVVPALIVAHGCRAPRKVKESWFAQTDRQRREIMKGLPVRGPWSTPCGGLQCRILLSRDRVAETGYLTGTLVVRNTSTETVVLKDTHHFAAGRLWKLDDAHLPVRVTLGPIHCRPVVTKADLAPGRSLVMSPVKFCIPPRPGRHDVTASFFLSTCPRPSLVESERGSRSTAGSSLRNRVKLTAPPVGIQVSSVDWGEPANGIRLRIAAQEAVVNLADRVRLAVFIHSMDGSSLLLPAFLRNSPEIARKDDLVTATYKADTRWPCSKRDPFTVHSPSFDLYKSFIEPGDYRLRIALEGVGTTTSKAGARSGEFVSNEIPIRVRPTSAVIDYYIATNIKTCELDRPLPLELSVKNLRGSPIRFIDFGEHRSLEKAPTLRFSNGLNRSWEVNLPLADGTPKPAPPKPGVRGAYSIVTLQGRETYRVLFPNVITPEVRQRLKSCDLPQRFTISFRWPKRIWHKSETWPFESEELFLYDWENVPSHVEVEFVGEGD